MSGVAGKRETATKAQIESGGFTLLLTLPDYKIYRRDEDWRCFSLDEDMTVAIEVFPRAKGNDIVYV